MNATKTKAKKINAATVWIMTQAGIDAGADINHQFERLRDIFERGIPRPAETDADWHSCMPVEINIRLTDINDAVSIWTKVCGDAARVLVIRHHKPSYDRYNTVCAG